MSEEGGANAAPLIIVAGQSNASQMGAPLQEILPQYRVVEHATGGIALLQRGAMPDCPDAFWLNPTYLQQLCGYPAIDTLVWIQGETEALNGITAAEYTDGLLLLRKEVEACAGPIQTFMVCPVAVMDKSYIAARQVLASQYRCAEHGMLLGPEYYDLLGDEIHIGNDRRVELAQRIAALILQRDVTTRRTP